MKKKYCIWMSILLLLFVVGCQSHREEQPKQTTQEVEKEEGDRENMQISIQGEVGDPIVFQLNDSTAARSLYEQLPFSMEVEAYGSSEKIGYPPTELNTTNTPMAKGPKGTLAYYEPWGNIAIFETECEGGNGLYALGEVISDEELIKLLDGQVQVRKVWNEIKEEEDDMHPIQVTIGNQVFTASLQRTAPANAFMERLPMTLDMRDLHGNEKYFYVSEEFPTAPQAVSQIQTGDIKLFGSDCLVLFYEDFSTSYSYTSLGKIDDIQGFREALGTGVVSVHFAAITN